MVFSRLLVLGISLILLGFQGHSLARDIPLPAAQAFGFKRVIGPDGVIISFDIAKGYHLYLERLKIKPGSEAVVLGPVILPEGELVSDPTMGHTRIIRGHVDINVPFLSLPQPPEYGSLQVTYQGCQDAGSCYPPQREAIPLEGVRVSSSAQATPPSECEARSDPDTAGSASEECQIVATLKTESLLSTGLSFLGMGILLAFTPCIFPMIPILSGLIAGQGSRSTPGAHSASRWPMFWRPPSPIPCLGFSPDFLVTIFRPHCRTRR